MRKFTVETKDLSRQKLANPFSVDTLHQRLREKGAVDLTNNKRKIDFGNGYSKFVPLDKNKKF